MLGFESFLISPPEVDDESEDEDEVEKYFDTYYSDSDYNTDSELSDDDM